MTWKAKSCICLLIIFLPVIQWGFTFCRLLCIKVMVLPVKTKLGNSFLRMGTRCAWIEVVFNGMTSDTGTRSDVGTIMSGVGLTCCQLHPPINDGELKDCFATGCHHVSEIDSSLSISNQHWAVQQPTNLGTPIPSSTMMWNFVILYKAVNNLMIWERALVKERMYCMLSCLNSLSIQCYFKRFKGDSWLHYLLSMTLIILGLWGMQI